MAYILVRHNVEDWGKWKPVFDDHSGLRSNNGSKGGKVFRSVDNPNEVFVLLEWDSLTNAQNFSQSAELKEAMQEAGVVGMPDMYFIEEAAETAT